nr:hypothetical protein [Longimycelium tulufanense]
MINDYWLVHCSRFCGRKALFRDQPSRYGDGRACPLAVVIGPVNLGDDAILGQEVDRTTVFP